MRPVLRLKGRRKVILFQLVNSLIFYNEKKSLVTKIRDYNVINR